MKEYYEIENDKVIAYDSNYGKQGYKYQDNIEEILKKENIIEGLEDYLLELKDREKDLISRKNECVNSILSILKKSAIIILLMTLFTLLLYSSYDLFPLLKGINIKFFCIGYLGTQFFLGSSVSILETLQYYKIKKILYATAMEETFTENYIKRLNNELEKLKLDNKITKDNLKSEKEKKYVNYRALLENYKLLAQLIFLIKYNEKKYEDYYNKGILKEKMDEKFNSDDVSKLVLDYFDAKKYTLKNKE